MSKIAQQEVPPAPQIVVNLSVQAYSDGKVVVRNMPSEKLITLDVLASAMREVIRWKQPKIQVVPGIVGGNGGRKNVRIKGV